jgi:hypothetical protein
MLLDVGGAVNQAMVREESRTTLFVPGWGGGCLRVSCVSEHAG